MKKFALILSISTNMVYAATPTKEVEMEPVKDQAEDNSLPDRPWGRDSDYGPYRGEYKTGPNHEFAETMGNIWKPTPTPANLVEKLPE